MTKVILQGYITIPQDDRQAILSALEIHKQLTLAETGCLTFQIIPCTDDDSKFNVYEEFIDMQAFEYHQQRVQSSEWGKVSANVKRYYQPVRVVEE